MVVYVMLCYLLVNESCYYDRCVFMLFFFFFQAEDGIRDLVRSRGLGDVYKRQVWSRESGRPVWDHRLPRDVRAIRWSHDGRWIAATCSEPTPVSYTHLTLPTSDLV